MDTTKSKGNVEQFEPETDVETNARQRHVYSRRGSIQIDSLQTPARQSACRIQTSIIVTARVHIHKVQAAEISN